MTKKISVLLFVLFICAGSVFASEKNFDDVESIGEVVVTATGTDASPDRLGGNSVTVITRKDIEAMKPSHISEVLRTVPGLEAYSSGGPGTLTSVFLRGADSKNTLILVDGVIFNDPSSANRSADISNLNVDNIERIEVVRGPMSVVYGSNATSGVVNIITKKGKGPFSGFVDLSYGSYETSSLSAGASGKVKNFDYSLTASGTHSKGFSIADKENDGINRDGNTSEKDGFRNITFSGRAGVDFSPDMRLDIITRHTDSWTDLDDFGNGYAGDAFVYDNNWNAVPDPSSPKKMRVDSRQNLTKASLKNSFADRSINTLLSYQFSDIKRDNRKNDGSKDYFYEGRSHEVTAQCDLNVLSGVLSLGTSYYREIMESSSIDEKHADIVSFRALEQFMPTDALTVVVGLRYDDHEEFGGKTTWRLAPSYALPWGTVLKASYGTGFRAPSLYELFEPTYGNDSLSAEKSKGWDVGVEQKLIDEKITLGCTYFNMVFNNRIGYDFATSRYNQLSGDTDTSGVEAFMNWAVRKDLDLGLAFTYTDTEDPDGARLARRPYTKYNFNARYLFLEKTVFNLDVQQVGKRRESPFAADADGNPVKYLGSYTLVNLAVTHPVSKNVELYGRIDNLFDKYYEEAWSYATAGLSGYVGVKITK